MGSKLCHGQKIRFFSQLKISLSQTGIEVQCLKLNYTDVNSFFFKQEYNLINYSIFNY